MNDIVLNFTGKIDIAVQNILKKQGKNIQKNEYLIMNLDNNINDIDIIGEFINNIDYNCNLVSLANTKFNDIGNDRLIEFIEYLNKQNIDVIGAGRNRLESEQSFKFTCDFKTEKKDIIIISAFRGSVKYQDLFSGKENQGILPLNPKKMNDRISQIRMDNQDAIIIIYPNWNEENHTNISPFDNEKIRNWSRNFIESGANFVIGHGPKKHDIFESYKDGLIWYSLGNESILKIKFGYDNNGKFNISPMLINNKRIKSKKNIVSEHDIDLLELVDNKVKINFEFKENDIFFDNYLKINYDKYIKAGYLLEIDYNLVGNVQDYWAENYGKYVDTTIHLLYEELYGEEKVELIPGTLMRKEIIPYFNSVGRKNKYNDKNLYNLLFPVKNQPKTILKYIKKHLFDANGNCLTMDEADKYIITYKNNMIIKPSMTDDGEGINKIIVKDDSYFIKNEKVNMESIINKYNTDFIIQESIIQSDIMALPHKESVNTLRMVTLRWKNDIYNLLTFARFGTSGNVNDNAGTGGLVLGVKEDGSFYDFALDGNIKKYHRHPTTGFYFSQMPDIPDYNKILKYVRDLHKLVLHHDYISWDIALDQDENPIFIEANFMGATWLYQIASRQPIFGDLTSEILNEINNSK